jgi:lambda repressor-like predicted transcriptional regulator
VTAQDTAGHAGDRNCHARGCRLPQCRDAARAWWRDYYQVRKQYNGRPSVVPVDRALAHVARLRGAGMSDRAIMRAAGLGEHTLRDLPHRTHGILTTTEARILAVRPGAHHQYLLPALGTTRRLRALGALGWTLADLAAHTTLSKKTLSLLMAGAQPYVTREAAEQIDRAYNQLCMRRGPSERSRLMAQRKRWAPPLAWDEGTIDDPAASPVMGAERADAVLNLAEFMRLMDCGELPEQAAARCGVTLGAIEVAARRHGRDDVLDRIARRARRLAYATS